MFPKKLLFTYESATLPQSSMNIDNILAERNLLTWQAQILNGNQGRDPIAQLIEMLADISLEEVQTIVMGIEDFVNSPRFNREQHEKLLFWTYHACLQKVRKSQNVHIDKLALFEEAERYIHGLLATLPPKNKLS